jgi:hypothetical protein
MAIHRQRGRGLTALAVSFLAGTIAGGALVWRVETPTASGAVLADDCGEPDIEVRPSKAPTVPKVAPPGPTATVTPQPESDSWTKVVLSAMASWVADAVPTDVFPDVLT